MNDKGDKVWRLVRHEEVGHLKNDFREEEPFENNRRKTG